MGRLMVLRFPDGEEMLFETQAEFENAATSLFADKMRRKLTKHRDKNPDSWKGASSIELRMALEKAAQDRDWVSVANYAMMLDNNRNH